MVGEMFAAAMFVIIVALVVTNPSGDSAVLGGGTNLVTGLTNSLSKGVK